ncbi:MAG: hypothetical protein PHE29_14070, partial [Tissierellia bacterium]|nr:hypothetical protein [Tissierellia bacterium]
MNKEEAKERQAELKCRIETYLDDIKRLNDEMSELETIINKKDDWKSVEVPDDIWQALYEEKALLMADMMHFAYARNEGWVPDWENGDKKTWGLTYDSWGRIQINFNTWCCDFIFGIAVKSEEIAQEMLE